MKRILFFLLMLFIGNTLIGNDLKKEEFIKDFKSKKIFYRQNKKNKEEMISIEANSVLKNDDFKNFHLFDRLTYFAIYTPKNITNEGLFHLNNINTFKIVKLCGPNITDDSLKLLEKSENLESLDLCSCSIDGSGLKYIADKIKVDTLNFDSVPITDDGIKHVKDLVNITNIVLNKTKITDNGLSYLVNLKKLRRLSLYGTNITDKSIPYIIDMMGNKQNQYDTYLIIYKTKISRNGVKKLLDAGIKVNCDYKDLSSEIP